VSEDWNLDEVYIRKAINPLNGKLNPICHLLALLVAHLILHIRRIRVKCPHLSLVFGVLSIKLCDSIPDFNVHGSVHHNNIQIYPTRCNVTQFILYGNCSTCFGRYHHPSSGVQTTVSTATGICHTVIAICRYCGRVGGTPPTAHSNQFQLFHDSGR
jgi:hypothetical protein